MENWALVTGASTGIGRELAELFASKGFHLAVVARNKEQLDALAGELTARHKIIVKVFAHDLSRPGAALALFESLREIPISVLVNNAGFGSYGPFADSDLHVQTEMMQVNMVALVQLTHLFLQPMRSRNAGRILNVASTAAFQPGPMLSIYYATKAFVLSFSYALSDELNGTNVTVTALCPGLTRTQFQKRAHLREGGPWRMMSAREVAAAGYRGLMKGQRVVIPGLFNKVGAFIARRVPYRMTSAIVRKIHES